jgi:hypothetical protein
MKRIGSGLKIPGNTSCQPPKNIEFNDAQMKTFTYLCPPVKRKYSGNTVKSSNYKD